MRYTLLLSLLSLPMLAIATDGAYKVSAINPSLLPSAYAVVRMYELKTDILSPTEIEVSEHTVITILDEKGDHFADETVAWSASLEKLENIQGDIYDADGAHVRRIKKADFLQEPMYAGNSHLSDELVIHNHTPYHAYPYTVEYTVRMKQNSSYYIHPFCPVTGLHCAVEDATFTLQAAPGISLRYKEFETGVAPAITKTGDGQTYHWQFAGLPARVETPYTAKKNFEMPAIAVALDDFKMGGYTGSAASWKDLGKFIYELNKGRDSLPRDVQAHVKSLTEGITDAHKKISLLYSYLQNTMRYVAVEYGVGGWQTLDAAYLSKNNYGDCKALSNYMMAMLEAVGIVSYPVVIYGGNDNDRAPLKDFVYSTFNHVILCVPMAGDTVWLECTSRDLPAGYLSDFTQDRNAMMITPAGGVMVHTPVYGAATNVSSHHAYLSCNGSVLQASMHNYYQGEEASVFSAVAGVDDEKKQAFIRSEFKLGNYTVGAYDFTKVENAPVSAIRERADITAQGMITKSGGRTFVNMDVAPLRLPLPDDEDKRNEPFYFPESYSSTDTFELQIPERCDVALLLPAADMSYPFGSYTCYLSKVKDRVIMARKLVINSGTYDAAIFDDFIKMAGEADNESHKKVVLINSL